MFFQWKNMYIGASKCIIGTHRANKYFLLFTRIFSRRAREHGKIEENLHGKKKRRPYNILFACTHRACKRVPITRPRLRAAERSGRCDFSATVYVHHAISRVISRAIDERWLCPLRGQADCFGIVARACPRLRHCVRERTHTSRLARVSVRCLRSTHWNHSPADEIFLEIFRRPLVGTSRYYLTQISRGSNRISTRERRWVEG